MAREKFQTLTEQMFYILLVLKDECFGMDIMNRVSEMTGGRVTIGPGTLYHLLDEFLYVGMIKTTKVEGRKKSYILTNAGKEALEAEYQRLLIQIGDYETAKKGGSL